MKPNAKNYNPSPEHIRTLIKNTGLSSRQCADLIGVHDRTFRRYTQEHEGLKCPYPVQFCLEVLGND